MAHFLPGRLDRNGVCGLSFLFRVEGVCCRDLGFEVLGCRIGCGALPASGGPQVRKNCAKMRSMRTPRYAIVPRV